MEGAPYPLPGDDLRVLFETAAVALSFTKGDPVSSATDFDAMAQSLTPAPGAAQTGTLVIAGTSSESDIYGETFGKLHGLSVVYAGNLRSDGELDQSRFLQVCAHEIGHMCNLTHGDDPRTYPFTSIMLQAIVRSGSPQDAWTAGRKQAQADGDTSWGDPNRAIDCYPFGQVSRSKLAKPVSNWGPWTGDFAGGLEGAVDTNHDRGLVLSLHPHRSECQAGDDVAFDVHVKNIGDGPAVLPLNLHPRFSNLDIWIEGPDGARRPYRSPSMACSDAVLTVPPGDHVVFPVSILVDAQGVLLAQEGTHTIHVAMRALRGASQSGAGRFQLAVGPRRKGGARHLSALTATQIQRHVARRADLGALHHRAAVAGRNNTALLDIAIMSGAPRATRHAALLTQVAQAPITERKALISQIVRQYPTDHDRILHLKLARFDTGEKR